MEVEFTALRTQHRSVEVETSRMAQRALGQIKRYP